LIKERRQKETAISSTAHTDTHAHKKNDHHTFLLVSGHGYSFNYAIQLACFIHMIFFRIKVINELLHSSDKLHSYDLYHMRLALDEPIALAMSRSTAFWIFPVDVLGSFSLTTTVLGTM